MAAPNQQPIEMSTASELLDIEIERMIESPPQVVEGMESEEQDIEFDEIGDGEFGGEVDEFGGEVEVDDIDPLPLLTLDEAKLYASRLHEFVVVNNEFVKKAGCSSKRDYPRDMDAIVQALGSMNETTRSRQSSLLNWVVHSGSTGSCD